MMDMAFKQSMKGLQGFNLRGVVLLLNNQLTVDIFCNKEFVSNIRPAPEPLILKSNGGELSPITSPMLQTMMSLSGSQRKRSLTSSH
jgi:hypothetical protein